MLSQGAVSAGRRRETKNGGMGFRERLLRLTPGGSNNFSDPFPVCNLSRHIDFFGEQSL
jgi:hypothetical protein